MRLIHVATNQTRGLRVEVRKIDDEFVAQVTYKGRRNYAADYYTEDRADALNTAEAMVRSDTPVEAPFPFPAEEGTR